MSYLVPIIIAHARASKQDCIFTAEKFLEHSKTSIALIEALLLLCVGVLWWSGLPVFVRRAVERARVDIKTLQVLTGHKDLKSLLLYVERSPERAKGGFLRKNYTVLGLSLG